MRDNWIRIIITIVGLIALWRLWGTPYTIYWWVILVLIVLSWVTVKILKNASMVISILCLLFAVAGLVLSFVAPISTEETASKPAASPYDRPISSDDRENCRKAFVFFLNSHSLQWDSEGNKFELPEEETEQLKAYIKGGLENAEKVSNTFLIKIHPLLPEEFRERLVKGWSLYLEGLEKEDEAIQENGMLLLMEWEDFKADNVDLLYNSIIKREEEQQPSEGEG
jgi:hypothetical protein